MNTTTSPLLFSDTLERVQAVLPKGVQTYLVGGAVRDALLSRPTHDLDFVLPGKVLETSRQVANALGAAFYPLDVERDTARLILYQMDGGRQILDFAALRGLNLESDLRDRDFTINAMAIALHDPQTLLDPLGGASDLRAGLLRACSANAFTNDPIRIMRGVRQAIDFGLRILPKTGQLMRQAVTDLQRISPERIRDELFRMLDGPQPATALRALDILEVLPYVLPELPSLKGVTQSSPHIDDAWTHSLNVVKNLTKVLNVLTLQYDPEVAANWALGLVSLRLGRYRQQIHDHLTSHINPDRSLRALIFLAALYHDVGKPSTKKADEDGRVRFLEHERVGARIIDTRANQLRLSNTEVKRLNTIVRNHMRPLFLTQTGKTPSRRAIYRFFRDCGEAGVEVCLLSLADTLGTYGPTLPQEAWSTQLDVTRALLEAYWERPRENVSPPLLLTGHDLIVAFNLKPGPQIGRLLEMIREAQATGELLDRDEALAYALAHIESDNSGEER